VAVTIGGFLGRAKQFKHTRRKVNAMAALITAAMSYLGADILIPLILKFFGGRIATKAANAAVKKAKAKMHRGEGSGGC